MKWTFNEFFQLVENNLYVIVIYPRYKHKYFTPMTKETIKDDILMTKMRNIENDGSFNSEGAKRMRITDSLKKYIK